MKIFTTLRIRFANFILRDNEAVDNLVESVLMQVETNRMLMKKIERLEKDYKHLDDAFDAFTDDIDFEDLVTEDQIRSFVATDEVERLIQENAADSEWVDQSTMENRVEEMIGEELQSVLGGASSQLEKIGRMFANVI